MRLKSNLQYMFEPWSQRKPGSLQKNTDCMINMDLVKETVYISIWRVLKWWLQEKFTSKNFLSTPRK